ncbi:hypothetical protein J2S40_001143 [Nocardioides luteus]|uniref:Uncharacterized protein n=1 Tax=Nocardioides luteus TaxID=1844 RepID=A0ABQ5SVM8_9ACTN|nr:hypothetical protein [Nocardioides luteus]MDR7310085.1 hypothetical protein [Nocardioides luteus]GGR64963.1 hypothetical protein GCM10010197_35450 [Nocardioides luteus]GLJ67006.1 hypothetical protein GCM10017579_10420 [Nocardioides luteus]
MTAYLSNPGDSTDDQGPDVINYDAEVSKMLGQSDTGSSNLPGQPTEWVSPREKQRRRQAARALNLPRRASISDLQSRITRAVRLGTVPEVEDAERAARDAVLAAFGAYDNAGDEPGKARDVAAKDAVTLAISDATRAVGALERAVMDNSEEIFGAVGQNIESRRAQALADLKAALASFSAFRQLVEVGTQAGIDIGQYDRGWTMGVKNTTELNAAIAPMRAAIEDLESDDDSRNGRVVTATYPDGQFPPSLLAKWKRAAEIAGPGSFAEQVYQRARNPHPNDGAAVDAVTMRDSRILANASPIATTDLMKGTKSAPPAGFVAPVDRSEPKPSRQKTAYERRMKADGSGWETVKVDPSEA